MSITPTNYDLQQDSRIDEIQEIITTDYQEPDQTEYSYPVVDQPMSDEQWQYVTLGIGDGVLDEGGQPYWLRLNESEANTNSTNTMLLTVSTTVNTAQAALKGFFHRLMENKVLSLPGVTSETTYYVVLRYDPLDHDKPTGPISVQVVTALDRTQGKHYVLLWKVTRKPNQLLTDAKVERVRPKITPMITVDSADQMPEPSTVLWGTRCLVDDTKTEYRAGGATEGGPRTWFELKDAYAQPDGGTYKYGGEGARARSTRIGPLVTLEGRVVRTNGANFLASNSNGYGVFILPEDHRPAQERRFITKGPGTASADKSATIVVRADGGVYAYPHADNSWVGLDGCFWTVG